MSQFRKWNVNVLDYKKQNSSMPKKTKRKKIEIDDNNYLFGLAILMDQPSLHMYICICVVHVPDKLISFQLNVLKRFTIIVLYSWTSIFFNVLVFIPCMRSIS
ncbi:unnamed protein product [Musa textilis]